MIGETRSSEEIQRSLHGTRRRIEDDLNELSRRISTRADSVPGWVKGASLAAAVFLMRRPLFRLVRSVAVLSAPVVIPMIVGRIMERRSEDEDGYRHAYRSGESFGRSSSHGEEAIGEGRPYGTATYSP